MFNIWRGSHINLGWFSCRSSVIVKLECGYVGFCGGRKTEEPGGKPLKLGKNQQQTKPAYATSLELNSGLIGEGLVLSPLHHPCSPEERERGDCNLICLLWVTTLCPLSRQSVQSPFDAENCNGAWLVSTLWTLLITDTSSRLFDSVSDLLCQGMVRVSEKALSTWLHLLMMA